jgi:glyoxylate/hydroxypyruvate reductase A
MSMLFIAPKLKPESYLKHLRAQDPGLELRVWPEVGAPEDILMALTWKHPRGELAKLPRLRCIASLGFGVDHVLSDPGLPSGVPVTRLVDPGMIRGMTEYVIAAVLNHTRQFTLYRHDQGAGTWKARAPKHPVEVRIGILGLGHLGGDAALKLKSMGFPVRGWSRTPKSIEGVESFVGAEGLAAFLAQSDILICLLPLTEATQGILDRRTLSQLPAGAYVINAARGEHLVEEDLLAELDSGRLAGACLDVFRTEPLPAHHPFWAHPRVTVTPHIASLTFPRDVAPQLVENYRRVRSGHPPLHAVDVRQGY